MRIWIIIVPFLLLSLSVVAGAQDCSAGKFRQKRLQMLSLAGQCNVESELIASIGAGEDVDDQGACSQPISVNAQNEAFNECARVYLCAARTYSCALKRMAQGEDCQTAAQSCLSEFPVPAQ